jgi:Mrp family chromosome partitioning ATPase
MSRNFELLHQLGKANEVLNTETKVVESSVEPVEGLSLPVGSPSLEVDPKTREELVKLVQRLFLRPGADGARRVVFGGSEPGDGCTWITSRVAEILASQTHGSVCVVDCDLRAPSLHEQFQVGNHYGLADALGGEAPIRQYAQPLSRPNLWLVSCGSITESSFELAHSERMRRRMADLRSQFTFVIVDAGSFSTSTAPMFLGGLTDGVILVVKANSTRRDATRELKQQLQVSNVPLLGAVLNQRTFPIPEKIYKKL